MAYKAYICEIYGHLLKNPLSFVYKFRITQAYFSLNIDLGPIKGLSFLHFADHTKHF